MSRVKLNDEQVVIRFFATADRDTIERALANGRALLQARFPAAKKPRKKSVKPQAPDPAE